MLLSLSLFGFLLGVKHALEADHVAAVAALASRSPSLRGLLRVAGSWGLGHALALTALGSLLILLGVTIPPPLARGLELAVGATLILLGGDVLRRVITRRIHVHVHEHGGERHVHLHAHGAAGADHDHDHARPAAARAFIIGSVHGLAGSAALVLLAASRADSALAAIASLFAFGIGSVLGMLLFSAAISLPLRLSARLRNGVVGLEGVLGLLTVAIGVNIMAG